MGCKTRRASLRRAKKALYDWCRRHRHQPVEAQHAALGRRLRGHFNYFGVSGNFPSLLRLVEATKRAWYKWLCRRSQRKRLNWERFTDLLRQRPLPRPRITVRIWGGVTTRHIDGRAGWWQSPCPDLGRGRDGQPPGLLYNGLCTSPRRARPPGGRPRCWGGVLQRGFYSIWQSGFYTRNGMGFVRYCNCTEYL